MLQLLIWTLHRLVTATSKYSSCRFKLNICRWCRLFNWKFPPRAFLIYIVNKLENIENRPIPTSTRGIFNRNIHTMNSMCLRFYYWRKSERLQVPWRGFYILEWKKKPKCPKHRWKISQMEKGRYEMNKGRKLRLSYKILIQLTN